MPGFVTCRYCLNILAALSVGTILVTAVVQIVVHLVYFLHMNSKSDEGWNLTAFIFTVIIIAIVVVGSINPVM